MSRIQKKYNGFSLMELLIYIAILAISVGLLTAILMLATQSQGRESATSEVSSQLNFVMQTIQRLIRESSNIETASGVATTTLILRMKNIDKDPTTIKLEDGVIKMREKITGSYTDLTNSRVMVDDLQFKKLSQYQGHDIVSINLTMRYNTDNPKFSVSRTLQSAIARVSAATFDDNLIPGTSNFYDLGTSGSSWKNAYFSGNVGIGTTAPGEKLDISGKIRSSSGFVYNAGDGIQWWLTGTANGPAVMLQQHGGLGGSANRRGSLGWMDNNGANSEDLTWTDTGKVGIGTTNPLSKLAISDLPTSPPAGDTSGTQGVLCITNNGNVWIDITPATPCS